MWREIILVLCWVQCTYQSSSFLFSSVRFYWSKLFIGLILFVNLWRWSVISKASSEYRKSTTSLQFVIIWGAQIEFTGHSWEFWNWFFLSGDELQPSFSLSRVHLSLYLNLWQLILSIHIWLWQRSYWFWHRSWHFIPIILFIVWHLYYFMLYIKSCNLRL